MEPWPFSVRGCNILTFCYQVRPKTVLYTSMKLKVQFEKGVQFGTLLGKMEIRLIDWLIIYCLTFRSRSFHLYGDFTITDEGLQNLGLCSALKTFEQGGMFIMPYLLWHGVSVFPVLFEGPPHSITLYDMQGESEDLFLPGSSRVLKLEVQFGC
jgi:hypothetical protein